jgi:predicted O-methyltransferase YrrM
LLERLNKPGSESLSKPSSEAIEVLRRLKAECSSLAVAEVGVGIGASTVEFVRVMGGVGTLHLFDFQDVVEQLVEDLNSLDVAQGLHIIPHGNGRQKFNSYAWTLATMAAARRREGVSLELFDFVYLDGAHAFHLDASSCLVLKEMIKPGGYLVFDDMYWTFNSSPVMNPQKKPSIRDDYSDEQLSIPHVELVVNLFMRTDDRFEQIYLTASETPYRPVFRRLSDAELLRKRANAAPLLSFTIERIKNLISRMMPSTNGVPSERALRAAHAVETREPPAVAVD